MTELRFVTGAGGARLAVRVAGDPAGQPIVLLHGWASAGTVWAAQLTDPELAARHRLIAVDLRGHGESHIPGDDLAGYADPATWAGDVAAVLDFAGQDEQDAVVVGWSYGGLVLTDYLRVHGCRGVAGLVLVGALTEIGGGHPGGAVGPAMRAAMRAVLAEDPEVAVPALAELIAGMTAQRADSADVQRRLGDALRVPPSVRRALFRRDVSSANVLAGVSVPALVLHGTEDAVVAPSAAAYAAGKIPGASMRWFSHVGHLPFAERVAEFNTALLAFAGKATAS